MSEEMLKHPSSPTFKETDNAALTLIFLEVSELDQRYWLNEDGPETMIVSLAHNANFPLNDIDGFEGLTQIV